jgi:hypothetical protein
MDDYVKGYGPHDRVPVQGDGPYYLADGDPRKAGSHPPGTIEWWEHVEAWNDYARKYSGQPAHVVAGRGGFGYSELFEHLGHEPKTWRPRFAQPPDRDHHAK